MKLYNTSIGVILQKNNKEILLDDGLTNIINRDNLFEWLSNQNEKEIRVNWDEIATYAPLEKQEVWAAGVTYLRSRDARIEESKDAGGADFYSKVYNAERPELFFKSMPHRVAAHNEEVFIRKDSSWNVPEPELTVFINSKGNIQAYTIGNDMSSRDIEGENPLYLPQAKMYERSAALGPCLFIPEKEISPDTIIHIAITRKNKIEFDSAVSLNRMKRKLHELATYLFREMIFEDGVFLMTGTGIVPPADFTLHEKDIIDITIDGIGTLSNTVACRK